MKHMAFLFGLIFYLATLIYGQDSNDFFLDEFSVSINHTSPRDFNTENSIGFGLGAYHAFMEEKKLNLLTGFEYNRTNQFIESMYQGHFAHATDLTYKTNCLSMPLGLRINFGAKTKFFIETGAFADLLIGSSRSGTMHTYLPDENNQVNYTTTKIDERAKLSSTFGLYFGLGLRIPMSGFELIVKPDYKFGFNEMYSYQDNIYNRYLRISIGIGLP